MEKVVIRAYQEKDRKAVENVHFKTGLMGKSMSLVLSTKNEWKHFNDYYLEKEPESSFVLEIEGKVVGYLLGCLDDKKYSGRSSIMKMVFWALLKKSVPKKDKKFWKGLFYLCLGMMGFSDDRKFRPPKKSGHLHIDILEKYRGKGYGSQLLKKYFTYAKRKKVKRIYAGSFLTKLNPNRSFWLKNGFTEFSRNKTLFWKSVYPDENIKTVVYIKRLK